MKDIYIGTGTPPESTPEDCIQLWGDSKNFHRDLDKNKRWWVIALEFFIPLVIMFGLLCLITRIN